MHVDFKMNKLSVDCGKRIFEILRHEDEKALKELLYKKVYLYSWATWGCTWVLSEHSVRNIKAVVADTEEEFFRAVLSDVYFMYDVMEVWTPEEERDSEYDCNAAEDPYTIAAVERMQKDRDYLLKMMEEAKDKFDKGHRKTNGSWEYYTLDDVIEGKLPIAHSH